MATKQQNSLEILDSWPRYLIEFRGGSADFRVAEFLDCFYAAAVESESCSPEALKFIEELVLEVTIPDNLHQHIAACSYVQLPNEAIAKAIALRCSCLRRIVEVWGDGSTPTAACIDAIEHYDSRVAPVFKNSPAAAPETRRWRAHFNRVGRMGPDPAEKRQMLSKFQDLFQKINGSVDLYDPLYELLYIEDWHSFMLDQNQLIADYKLKENKISSERDTTERDLAIASFEEQFKPNRCIIGRIIAEAPSIAYDFDLRRRPFVGTTSMNAICSQLAVNAAHIRKGHRVLDPFCGTGSLLIAAAYCGAEVIGSDIDGDCLLGTFNNDTVPYHMLSKNARFKRKGGGNQIGLCTIDNFKFYGLSDQIISLSQRDAKEWSSSSSSSQSFKFDAIVTDPPFGKRERVFSTMETSTINSSRSSSPLLNEESNETILLVLQIAEEQLIANGRIAFWLPTKAHVTEEEVKLTLLHCASYIKNELQFIRATPEKLNESLWRWLCVFSKTK